MGLGERRERISLSKKQQVCCCSWVTFRRGAEGAERFSLAPLVSQETDKCCRVTGKVQSLPQGYRQTGMCCCGKRLLGFGSQTDGDRILAVLFDFRGGIQFPQSLRFLIYKMGRQRASHWVVVSVRKLPARCTCLL